MRHVKHLLSFMLAAVMALAMAATPAFATQGTNSDTGKITITNAEVGHTYKAYQVLVLESYNTEKGAYSYKANDDWTEWLRTQTKYVSIDDQGYVTWVKDADAAAFAKAALAHAEDAKITPDATKTAEGTRVEFTDLNLGYYLVDTTVGSLCSLDTTTPDVEMKEKNKVPPVDKKVQEDSDGSWGDSSTAEIGDTIPFQTTITAYEGAENYVLHDKMSDGLTLNPESITVAGLEKGTDANSGDYHVVTTGLNDECTFEVVFHQSYLDTIDSETQIVVEYSAVLNENAVIAGDGNDNITGLKYGDDGETTWDETKTYTYKVDVVKTDGSDEVLDGAQFKLYDAKTDGNEIKLVDEGNGVYRLAKDGETGVEYITTVNGQLEIKGFDSDTYWLEETKAPDGYNKLGERVEITVKDANNEATVEGGIWDHGGIHVVNKAGSLLPTTGGMGTTIFYVAGGAIVIAAAATLVYRKRMSK